MAAADLVEYVAKSLVDDPEAVKVEVVNGEDGTIIELHVAESDMGKVIGRNGSVAKALRTLLKVTSARDGRARQPRDHLGSPSWLPRRRRAVARPRGRARRRRTRPADAIRPRTPARPRGSRSASSAGLRGLRGQLRVELLTDRPEEPLRAGRGRCTPRARSEG